MNKKSQLLVATIGLIAVFTAAFVAHADRQSRQGNAPAATVEQASMADSRLVAGPGKVEPLSEDIKVSSEVSGRLKSVFVEEGDHVRRGEALAELRNDDYRAQVATAEAEVLEREAELRKTINGARAEERREARAAVDEAQAVMENARSEMERRQRLYRDGVVTREEAERYEREYKVAKSRYEEASQHFAFVDDPAREEDRARGEAEVALARARLDDARARYAKTFVRSPIDGVVLRKHHRPGESVTVSSSTPDPIVTLGDLRALRVRVDVDEDDVARVRVGDRAYVTADAFGHRQFWGRVVRVGEEMGPKNVRTDEPTERVDKKILETLIELDDGRELPVGLRVDSYIVVNR